MQSSARHDLELPIIPPYRDSELVQSHLRRTADANFISMSQLGAVLIGGKRPTTETERREAIRSVSSQLGYPTDLVEALTFTGFLVKTGTTSTARQACPQCLALDMTSSALLTEPSYAICPTHGLGHLVRCPGCQRNLSWGAGSYFHCRCGFDLRLGERVKVDPMTLELFRACLENRPLLDPQTTMIVDAPGVAMERLRSSLEYLLANHGTEGQTVEIDRESYVSSVVSQWESIGLSVGGCPTRLNDKVMTVEARMVFSKAKPEWAISRAERAREAITWTHLRDLARDAYRHVMTIEQPIDGRALADILGLDPRSVLAVQLESDHHITPPIRAEIRAQLNKLKRKTGDDPEREAQRLAALISLTRELRSVQETDWLEHFPIDGQEDLLALIAAGALHPWVAVQIENWHVLQSDVERCLQPVAGRPFPDADTDDESDPYGADFQQIFSARVAPSDWLGLSLREIEDRVTKLVRMRGWPVSSFDYMRDELALPLGFCAFLSEGPLMVYGDPKRKRGLGELVLISQTWQIAVDELVRVCLRAQANFARQNAWQRLAADVAWNYSLRQWLRVSKVALTAEANAAIAKVEPHPHKAMSAAIKAYEATL